MTHHARTTNTRLEPRMCVWISAKIRRVRCGVHTSRRLQQTTVSSKRSNCNKLSLDVWGCVKQRHNESHRSIVLSTWAQLQISLMIVMSSTRNRSTATKICWMKKMMEAIAGIARKESARVALLQTLGEGGVFWSTLRWSQNDLSPVRFFQTY